MKMPFFVLLAVASVLSSSSAFAQECRGLFEIRARAQTHEAPAPKSNDRSAAARKAANQPFSKTYFDRAKLNVKKQFVGLDPIIDTIFSQIESWYLAPETRKVPTVIVMPGMTGTGKTALVRSVIAELQLARDFYYFDMESYSGADKNFGSSGIAYDISNSLTAKDVKDPLELSVVRRPDHPVFMFDEFQKINTIDPSNGKPVPRPNAQAVFELLGNMGKLKVDNPAFRSLRSMLENPDLYLPIPSDVKYGGDKEAKEALTLKLLKLANERYKTEAPQLQLDLSNSLIFIGANLDSVYTASRLSDPDAMTADELHRATSVIRPSDIRAGLLNLYRPEHVGRLGSRFVSFPTLPAEAFKTFIANGLKEIRTSAKKNYGLQLTFSKRFVQRIYDEGVVPTQGMRPLLQSINVFALDPVANVYSAAKKAGGSPSEPVRVVVDIETANHEQSAWRFESGPLAGQVLKYEIPSEYLRSMRLRPEPYKSHVAVRLAAKITLSADGDRGIPAKVRANARVLGKDGVISYDREGTSGEIDALNMSYATRSQMVSALATEIAAYAAEKMIFGEPSRASQVDLQRATIAAGLMAGEFGMSSNHDRENSLSSVQVLSDRAGYRDDVEALLRDAYSQATKVLAREKDFFAAISGELTRKVELVHSEISTIKSETWSTKPSPLRETTAAQDFIRNPGAFKFHEGHDDKNPIGF